jgi:RimJ/RimL family protein N-acetyltransferase
MLTGKKVRLRALEKEDVHKCVNWLNDPDVIKYLYMNSPLSKALEEKWIDDQLVLPPSSGQVLAIEALDGDQWVHIGNTGLDKVEPVNQQAEFGIFIGDKNYWNKGYGREVTLLILKHGFEDLNLNRIYLYVFEENLRAIAAYKAVGFIQEGVLRNSVYKNGRFNNMLVMSVLHSEWRGFNND